MGMIANVKAFYRPRVVDHRIFNVDRSKAQGKDDVPDLKVTLLMAVQFLYGAWYEVRRSTIRNCFLKAGFLPPAPADDEPHLEDALLEEDQLNDEIRCLWKQATDSNLVFSDVSLQDNVHSDDNVLVSKEATDDAILNEVCESRNNVADDDASDEDDDASPSMSCTAAFRAIDALKDFVADPGLPVEYVAHLDAFECMVVIHMNNQKQAKLTSYF